MESEGTTRTAFGRRLYLGWFATLAVALTAFGATSAGADAEVVPLTSAPAEAAAPCVEVAEEGVECEYVPPAPPPEPTPTPTESSAKPSGASHGTGGHSGGGTADGAGLGAATAVGGDESIEPTEPVEREETPAAEPTESSEAPLEQAETLEAPEDHRRRRSDGTAAHPPRILNHDGGVEADEPPVGPAAPAILGHPAGGGLAGASALPLGQIELPPLLLPVYQACGTAYEVPWEVLAAINKIESGFGSNMGPSSAGAIGPMQFMPATWAEDGLDANGDGVADPWDPFDAICAAARYLHESGAPADLHGAVFAYNHAGWYVEEVLREARDYEALPENLLSSMTGLAEGETTPDPQATGYRELATAAAASIPNWVGISSPFGTGAEGQATDLEGAAPGEPRAEVSAPAGSPVRAVADATVIARGHSAELGSYVVLRDPYGTRYTYSGLGPLRRKVKASRGGGGGEAVAVAAGETGGRRRLYAHPPRRRHEARVALRKGAKVEAGTVLAEVGASSFDLAIQPDGSAPIPPVEFLRAWERGGAGGIYLRPGKAAKGRGAKAVKAGGREANPATILIAGERSLRERALHGDLLKLPSCLRRRIAAGALAPRALAGVEFLAAQSGERVGLSAAACRGADRFRLRVTSLGGAPLDRRAPQAAALASSARGMQGAMGPQRIHGPGLGAAAEVPVASGPSVGAAQARISSSPAGPTAPSVPGSAGPTPEALELDFLPPRSATLGDGDATAPVGAPAAVQAMIAAADQINQTPYIWGGGHGAWVSAGYDCSGSVSYVLHAAGLLSTPETSGSLESFGAPGPGRWVTIYANAEHVYAEIAGIRWDTVGDARGSGPRWHLEPPYPEGFVVRHPVGL